MSHGKSSYIDTANQPTVDGIFLSEGYSSITSLWKAVITQALMDVGSNSKKKEFTKAKAEAQIWLLQDNDDFREVCHLADMDPDDVRQKAIIAIQNGCKWRKESIKTKNNKILNEKNHNNIFQSKVYCKKKAA